MRIAILSDIHGNEIALKAVLQDLSQQPAIDQTIVAGDLCLNGPRPRATLEIVRELGCPVIQGNVDTDVVLQRSNKGPKKRTVVAWTREQLGTQWIEYLANLPFSYQVNNEAGSDLLVVHANPLTQDEAIFPSTSDGTLEHFCQNLSPDIGALAFGHYHVAYQRQWRNLLLVDAGSCGLPRDLDHRASYAILSWQDDHWQAEHRRVEYDVEAVIEQLKDCGLPAGTTAKRIRVLTEAHY
jgi:putative phosphoesterase